MRIGDLDGVAIPGRQWTALITNRVVSNLGTPVAGATVSGEWRGGGTSSCVTNATGSCDVSITSGKSAMIWTVVSVTHPTLTYTPAQNADPDGDSNGTEIWLYRP
jgi:hypothetical protein